MDRKIKVLVVPSDRIGGVGLYRSVRPHTKLNELYGEEFDVEIDYEPDWTKLENFDKYDIIHFHKGLYQDMNVFWNALRYFKEHNIVTIMDIDDNWDVGQFHPLHISNKAMKAPEKITQNLTMVDYVTTTTEIFANKIRKWNKNVFVYPNAIDPEESQFSSFKNPSNKIRFGFVMGSSHERDMEQFKGVINTLDKETLDKIQIVLCGFDLRGSINVVDKDGNFVENRPIKPMESVWYRYEQNVTDNYKIVSEPYKNFLLKFAPNVQWPDVENETYRREWTKDINNFGKHYANIDVLLAPLDCNSFNEVKSELKFVEGGFTKTAIVASNYGPYTLVGKSIIQKGGEIDETGNCILIDPSKKHKAWAKAIKKLVSNPELITLLQNNLYEFVKDTYNINNVTKKRAEWYKSIVKKTE